MITVFLGPPGSGKGTQAQLLMQAKGWPQLSTGDMFRANIKEGTKLGLEAKSYMDKGDLVPDSVVIGMIKERIANQDCNSGFILDGFPRTLPQAEALDLELKGLGKQVDKVILFEISSDALVKRLGGRRSCENCGAVFHLEAAPPKNPDTCDKCGHLPLVLRKDDQPEVIENRLKVYDELTSPLVGYFEAQGKMLRLDAAQSPSEVTEKVLGAY